VIHLIELTRQRDIFGGKRTGRLREQGPTSITPFSTALTRRRPDLRNSEDELTEATWRAREQNGAELRNGGQGSSKSLKIDLQLLRLQVLLLAMKDGRAPLPVSRALWRGLQRYRLLNDPYDLGSVARRLLFLGDSRMLLAELRTRGSAKPDAEQKTLGQAEIASCDKSAN
jgi:hypothetical protein